MPEIIDEIKRTIDDLAYSPTRLQQMIEQIPTDLRKLKRIPFKWSIHEHACHIVQVNHMLIDRLEQIRDQEKVELRPYLPGTTVPDADLIDMDLAETLKEFFPLREKLCTVAGEIPSEKWENEIEHKEFTFYTPHILLRHILFHDQFHMYRIEELWLTKDEYLPNR